MPSVPIEMPSLTPPVLNRMPTHPAASAPRFTCVPRSARCMLQGFPSYQTLPMPICGLSRSDQDNPVAINIACEAPWLAGCVMREENLFSCCFDDEAVAVGMIIL